MITPSPCHLHQNCQGLTVKLDRYGLIHITRHEMNFEMLGHPIALLSLPQLAKQWKAPRRCIRMIWRQGRPSNYVRKSIIDLVVLSVFDTLSAATFNSHRPYKEPLCQECTHQGVLQPSTLIVKETYGYISASPAKPAAPLSSPSKYWLVPATLQHWTACMSRCSRQPAPEAFTQPLRDPSNRNSWICQKRS